MHYLHYVDYHRHHRCCGRHRHHTLRLPNDPQPTPTTATIAAIATPSVRCIEIIKNSPSVKTLDITGGAPEMNDITGTQEIYYDSFLGNTLKIYI